MIISARKGGIILFFKQYRQCEEARILEKKPEK